MSFIYYNGLNKRSFWCLNFTYPSIFRSRREQAITYSHSCVLPLFIFSCYAKSVAVIILEFLCRSIISSNSVTHSFIYVAQNGLGMSNSVTQCAIAHTRYWLAFYQLKQKSFSPSPLLIFIDPCSAPYVQWPVNENRIGSVFLLIWTYLFSKF